MKYVPLFFVTLLFLSLIFSCDEAKQFENTNQTIIQNSYTPNSNNWTNIEGVIHNLALEHIFDFNNSTPGDTLSKSQVVNGLFDYIINYSILDTNYYPNNQSILDSLNSMYDVVGIYDLEELSDILNLNHNQNFYTEMIEDTINHYLYFEVDTNIYYQINLLVYNFQSGMQNVEQNIIDDLSLTLNQKELLLAYCSITLSSSDFWLNQSSVFDDVDVETPMLWPGFASAWYKYRKYVTKDANGFFEGHSKAVGESTMSESADPSSGATGYELGEGVKSAIAASAK